MILGLIFGAWLFVVLSGMGWWIGRYNFFKQTLEAIDAQASNIITEYERRIDLLLNLAKGVNGFNKHERRVILDATAFRSNQKSGVDAHKMSELQGINKMLSGLNISVEAYPELKSQANYKDLMLAVESTEDRINAARTGFNTLVREFESSRVSFPDKLVAGVHNISEVDYYSTDRANVSGEAPVLDV